MAYVMFHGRGRTDESAPRQRHEVPLQGAETSGGGGRGPDGECAPLRARGSRLAALSRPVVQAAGTFDAGDDKRGPYDLILQCPILSSLPTFSDISHTVHGDRPSLHRPPTGYRGRMEPLGHDAAYKGFYGHPFMVEELARWMLPSRTGGRQLVDALDFATLARVQEQSVGEGRRRSNDMVWWVRFRESDEGDLGAWMHLVLMLEFQSEVDHLMALRCRQYVDNFHMENLRGRRFGAADRLPRFWCW